MLTTDPVGQGQQSTTMISQPAKTSLDIVATVINGFPESVSQQGHRTQPAGAVSAMPKTVARSFSLSHQLMARAQSNVVKRITVVCLVAKDVTAPLERREQTGGDFWFAGVQRCYFPSQWQESRSVHGVQLVSLGIATTSSTPRAIRVFAVASDCQRFPVHDSNQTSLSQLGQVLFHNIHEPLDFGRSQSATHGRLRWQLSPCPEAIRPILGLAGPRCRPFVHCGPEEDHDNFEVKESDRASRVPTGQVSDRIGIMPTRVRVPCLISFKKGFQQDKHVRELAIFPAFPLPVLAYE